MVEQPPCKRQVPCSSHGGGTKYSLIAQLVEHLTVNQVVPGSSPGRGANFKGQKMLISDNAGYKLFCETRKLDIPANSAYVRIYTKYEWAKDPEATQNKLELVLSLDELEKLRQSLSV